MIDHLAFVETLIKQRLSSATVFQATTDASDAEIDVQNTPGKSPRLLRVLLSRTNAMALHADPSLAERMLATLQQALTSPGDEREAVLDLRRELG